MWAVYAVCRSVAPGVHIERVEPNDRYWVWRSSSPYGVVDVRKLAGGAQLVAM